MSKGIKDIAVSYANDDYNAGIAEVFAKSFAAMGGNITANEAHEPNKASYRAEVATMGAATDNLAVFAYYGSGGITLMRNALETGAFSTFIGADGMLAQEVIDQIGAENLGSALHLQLQRQIKALLALQLGKLSQMRLMFPQQDHLCQIHTTPHL